MRRGILLVSLAGALVGAFALGRAGAQEGPDDMEAWKALAKTGPEHANLRKGVGTWTCECTCFQPGQEPKVDTGKSVRTEVLGGRFIREDFEGSMMGEAFKGIGFSGFNNATKQYEMVWMDSMGTGIMLMTGTETEPGKSWTYKGSFDGPGGMKVKSRIVTTKVSDDVATMEMFNDMGMGEMKCMEITYTRSK